MYKDVLKKYKDAFCSLQTNKIGKVKAPYKVVLLLSIID